MPHQPADSPSKPNSAPTSNTGKKVVFKCDVKTAVPFKPSASRFEMLWQVILDNNVPQIKIIAKSELIKGLVIAYIGRDFSEEHYGENALTLAAKLKRYEIVAILAKAVGTIELKNAQGDMALHIAIKNQDCATTSVLLQRSITPKISNKIYFDVLKLAHKKSLAAHGGEACKVAKKIEAQLLEYGYDNNELKFSLKDVSRAKRDKRVNKLEAQDKDIVGYLSRVYVK